jgi:hypothetical protein
MSPEAGFLVWIGHVPVLKYVPLRRKRITLSLKKEEEEECTVLKRRVYSLKEKSVQSC